jgi:hypothetical protein
MSGQQRATTIGAHQGLIGSQMNTPVDSWAADAVLLLRYFEASEVRRPFRS